MPMRNLATDLDRMDDDGGTPRRASLTTTLRLAADRASGTQQHTQEHHPATSVDATNDWYRRPGASHRRRDESARALPERSKSATMRNSSPAIVAGPGSLRRCGHSSTLTTMAPAETS